MILKGFFNINKPSGWTSSDVVVKIRGGLRKYLREKGVCEETVKGLKVGHMGTLDPDGTGVLVVAVGTAARLFHHIERAEKVYEAGFVFGAETDTLDGGGTVTALGDAEISKNIDAESVENTFARFKGEIKQVPPKYSSLSIGGKRAYDLAREGKDFEIPERTVNVYGINLLKVNDAPEKPLFMFEKGVPPKEFVLEIKCSGGTYIRSLARDMAALLGTKGYMSFINRTKSGDFELETAASIQDVLENPLKHLLPVEAALGGFEKFVLPDAYAGKVLNGVKTQLSDMADGQDLPKGKSFSVYHGEELVGIGESEKGILKIVTRL